MNQEEAARSRDPLFWAASGLIPLGIFFWFFHWQVIDPTRVTWLLRGDWGTNVIGWNAFRRDTWHWPLGYTQYLAWPTGVTVTYTDSGPLLCLLLKPFSAILPDPFQFYGAWLLICVVLQFASAALLLRPHARDRMAVLLGATLLTLMPTFLIRGGHACLFSHWTILLSLHVFINVKPESTRDGWFAALLFVTALIHPYLLLMVASIWGSDALRRGIAALRAGAYRELAKLTIRSMTLALIPVVAIVATAGVGGYKGAGGGFGYYSMALDALFNPGLQGYSRLLPAAPQGEGQIYEGFQYLGVGLLATVAAAALAGILNPEARNQLQRMSWLAWLAPALTILAALAISDDIQLHGRVIAHVSYDWVPFDLPAMFRASGRLFWPCAYALVIAALQIVFALPRALPLAICATALLVQASDLTAFAGDIRRQTAAAAQPEHFVHTPSAGWDELVASADLVEFQPTAPWVDMEKFYEIAWRATSVPRPVNIAYTSRTSPRHEKIANASRDRFLSGEVDPKRLYVLLDGCVPKTLDRSLLRELDGTLIIPPAGATYSFALKPPPPDWKPPVLPDYVRPYVKPCPT